MRSVKLVVVVVVQRWLTGAQMLVFFFVWLFVFFFLIGEIMLFVIQNTVMPYANEYKFWFVEWDKTKLQPIWMNCNGSLKWIQSKFSYKKNQICFAISSENEPQHNFINNEWIIFVCVCVGVMTNIWSIIWKCNYLVLWKTFTRKHTEFGNSLITQQTSVQIGLNVQMVSCENQ